MSKVSPLNRRLTALNRNPPSAWGETGPNARPNVHGLLRYPAMMVPRMQGDIIDTILADVKGPCRMLDPFVGSGTVMTESLVRNVDFTGIDINPLAAMVCEAKAAIDQGADIEAAAQSILTSIRLDIGETIDAQFAGRQKWFDDASAKRLSVIRRAILKVDEAGARKVMWTVFAETIRLCSNSRTSTYKLHVREEKNRVPAHKVIAIFEQNLSKALISVREYREILGERASKRPKVKILCEDIRKAKLRWRAADHQLMVTSPPYGDNKTTIPYGQFSYLTMRWIPIDDLPGVTASSLMSNTSALDSASLGGTVRGTEEKELIVRDISPNYDKFIRKVKRLGLHSETRKVSGFMGDFADSLSSLRKSPAPTAHWVITTGNRTAAGVSVPFDAICKDLVTALGGNQIASLQRRLPNKRMPSKNSQGDMITTETTAVIEFS